jgi:hypothetical protein
VAFDHGSPRWLGISDLIAEPEGPTFISHKVARSRLDRLRFVTQDPSRTSALGHPSQAHALNFAVAPGKVGGIVAHYIGGITKAANGEAWIERKSRLHCCPRFLQLPEPRKRSRKNEMCDGMVSVCVEAPA